MNAREIYAGSDGAATRAYYADLEKRGVVGLIGVNLFRAQKCSGRAKVYRGGMRGMGSYRSMAYDRKNWSLKNLSELLEAHAVELNIPWGWKIDPGAAGPHKWVLYVVLPQGQVSFHSAVRYTQRDFDGEWDGEHRSEERIHAFCDEVMKHDGTERVEVHEVERDRSGRVKALGTIAVSSERKRSRLELERGGGRLAL